VPPTVAAPIAVFRVRKQPYWRVDDARLGWGDRSSAGVEVHLVPGDHTSMLRPPQVGQLAAALTACLDRAAER
jgi:thioesterase domain-containing protein